MKATYKLINPHVVNNAVEAVRNAPAGHIVTISEPTRTLEQNSKLWPMLADIQRQVPSMARYSADDIKARFLHALGMEMRWLPELEGSGVFPVGMRSSTLTKTQFAALVELLYKFGAENQVKWSERPAD